MPAVNQGAHLTALCEILAVTHLRTVRNLPTCILLDKPADDYTALPPDVGPVLGADRPGPVERITKQIEIQAPLVDKLICYQYQGIMNRHTDKVDIGHPDTAKLYKDYTAYLAKQFPGRFRG